MAIERIDNELCNGCGLCAQSCPADVIRMDKAANKAVIRYAEDCVVCCWCVAECPRGAIEFSAALTRSALFTSWG